MTTSTAPATAFRASWSVWSTGFPVAGLTRAWWISGKGKDQARTILKDVANSVTGDGPLVITAVASNMPEEEYSEYVETFKDLGIERVELLGLKSRRDAFDQNVVGKIERAAAMFFTDGDQLRTTSQIADSAAYRCLEQVWRLGVTIAGTSAGAAAMSETMIVGGPGDDSGAISALGMAPGLGFIGGVVIDSHFAERGRFGRLIGAVAENRRTSALVSTRTQPSWCGQIGHSASSNRPSIGDRMSIVDDEAAHWTGSHDR